MDTTMGTKLVEHGRQTFKVSELAQSILIQVIRFTGWKVAKPTTRLILKANPDYDQSEVLGCIIELMDAGWLEYSDLFGESMVLREDLVLVATADANEKVEEYAKMIREFIGMQVL